MCRKIPSKSHGTGPTKAAGQGLPITNSHAPLLHRIAMLQITISSWGGPRLPYLWQKNQKVTAAEQVRKAIKRRHTRI